MTRWRIGVLDRFRRFVLVCHADPPRLSPRPRSSLRAACCEIIAKYMQVITKWWWIRGVLYMGLTACAYAYYIVKLRSVRFLRTVVPHAREQGDAATTPNPPRLRRRLRILRTHTPCACQNAGWHDTRFYHH